MKWMDTLQFGWRRRLPVMLQTQAAECGLACVGMIASYHGHDLDLVSLRRRFSPSLKGATLNDVMLIASRLDLTSRALRLELGELGKLKLPCILHWDMNHFVVLKSVSRGRITIHDPARGLRDVPLAEVSDHFTGIALELMPSPSFTRTKARESISMAKLVGSVTGMRAAFAQVLLLSVALEVFGIVTPFYMQWVMDQVLVSADADLLTLLAVGFLLVVLFQHAVSALRAWVVTWFSSLLGVQWTANVCAHLFRLPMTYFEQRHIGDVVSRFGAINTIQSALTTQFVGALLDGVMAVVTLAMLFVYSPTLTWLVLGLFAAYGAIRWIAYRPFRQANEEQIVYAARAESNLLESIRGVQAIKLANKQEARVATYANAVVETTNKHVAIERLSIGFSTLQGVISGAGRVMLVWLAAKQVLDGQFSAGMLVAFISFADQFIARGSGLVGTLIDFRMLRLHGERLADIVLTDVEADMEAKTARPADARRAQPPAIDVRDVRFRYAETEPWVLDGCSLSIAPGESVALVGPSGQGKTTMAKLLLGLLTPEHGSVRVDGVDIRKLGLHQHRELIGCVMQDDILFAGSIADNICFFDPQPDQTRIEEAARLAQIHDDIAAMPMGYQSLVGDMGSSLSGGQSQRVLLARAFYRKPAILVLDEATSHLDVERERLINDAVRAMNVTRIIVAHRPETIRSADRVIVLAHGCVREQDHDASALSLS
ncbi:peptidase domain-containing ABC transporter [Burkholderia stagnalis]|uniref:Peptidase domain-containing ABC transporter n=1 Tax=Burkholderia stagnalis TaxID=1503054 RepID=A0ABX9YBL6_9BURK|nr:peptidase domain-containing ABC transporter [Burkholderia stagnalis]RQQ57921.1 peptidase domain-containing ABC transporter [Burkholderia stagnalis]RQQ58060.1 peptidase domain-containing ABC transporter [Burkholderia stagnalis]RQQ71405.1 peptidase domain-containing ABC transporter [Burkholderia stagnalis]RQQ78346.1 peptidase domain-containing ABC transporter [Burkholderia stagnalis]